MPITVSLPCGRPIASAMIGCGARAIAQVARRDFRFGTTSTPSAPAAASAAPSATPQQPVAQKVTGERSDKRGVSTRRREAGKNRAGTPSSAASAWIAGSASLSSTETTAATAPGASPASASVERARSAISFAEQPRSQPIPSAKTGGWSTKASVSDSAKRSVTTMHRLPCSAQRTAPARNHPAQPASSTKATASPLRSADTIGFTLSALRMCQPGGGSSSATPRRTSPAVVIAAMPPMSSPIARASALAPWCPPMSGTATEPSSATATTAGSSCLAARKGATERIRMPLAQTPMIGRPASNSAPIWVDTRS